jgi:hypothetical protein
MIWHRVSGWRDAGLAKKGLAGGEVITAHHDMMRGPEMAVITYD